MHPPNVSQAASDVHSPAKSQSGIPQVPIFAIVISCVLINSLLAIVNAHGMAVSPAHVMIAEGILLAAGAAMVIATGLRQSDLPEIMLGTGFLALVVILSMINEAIYVDPLRNIAIIAIFSMLGARTDFDTLTRTMSLLCVLVLLVLAVEAYDVATYVSWFEPAAYYENSRGLENAEFNKTGLFGPTLSFENRFSFGVLDHRAGSLFLEQVSLANFAIAQMLFLITFWGKLPIATRVLHAVAILLFVATTDSRTATGILLVALLGYFLFLRLPKFATLLVIPACLILAFFVMADGDTRLQDDLVGRLTITMRTLANLELYDLLGFHAFTAVNFADSGYTYVLYSSTVFGLLALWLFVAGHSPLSNAGQRRCAFFLNAVFATSLLVAGTSIFTIKVASIIWLIAGVAKQWPFESDVAFKDDLAKPKLPHGLRKPFLAR